MSSRIYEVGERYGQLVVIRRREFPAKVVRCRCDCGVIKDVNYIDLGRSRNPAISCGCRSSRRVYEVGERYGRLTVAARREPPAKTVRCRCDCGTVRDVTCQSLGRDTNSCGCLQREAITSLKLSHGLTGSPEHKVWLGMIARCTYPSATGWKYYGARGIAVCDRWRDFAMFLADMGERPSRQHSIDRADVEGGYEPSNCRWATGPRDDD